MARKVLLDVDDQLLERFDAYWRACGFPSRRAAIRHALEVTVAQHAAHVQRERAQRAEPNPWTHGRQTPDRESDAASRPITADLAREAFG